VTVSNVFVFASSLMVVVPDEQGHACEGDDKFEGNDKDVLHNGYGFNGLQIR
jgi:hypothetical protein